MDTVGTNARKWARQLVPPALAEMLRSRTHTWEGIYSHVQKVPLPHGSYNDPAAVAPMVEQAASVLTGLRAGREERLWHESLAMVAARVANKRGSVRVVDFGGGAGLGFVQLTRSLPEQVGIEYHVVELPQMCAAAEGLFVADSRIQFHSVLPKGGADVVYACGALQYVEDYATTLLNLAAIGAPYLVLTSVAAARCATFATAQQNLPGGKFPYWVINLEEMQRILRERGYRLIHHGLEDWQYDCGNFPETHRFGRMKHLLFVRDGAWT